MPIGDMFKDEDRKKVGRDQLAILARGVVAPESNALNYYVHLYVAPMMSSPRSALETSELVGMLNQAIERSRRTNNAAFREQLNTVITLPRGKIVALAMGNYHPPGRVAAITMLCSVDAVPGDRRSNRPPQPHRNAYAVCKRVVAQPTAPDGVFAAALSGVRRFAETYGQLPSDQDAMVAICENLIATDAPSGRSAEAHAYLQKIASDILAALRHNQPDALATQLVSLAKSDDYGDVVALDAAERLGELGAETKAAVTDVDGLIKSFDERLVRIMSAEIRRLNSYDKPTFASRQPKDPKNAISRKKDDDDSRKKTTGMGGRGMGMGMGDMGMDDTGDMGMGMGMDMDTGMGMDMGMDMDMGMGMGMNMGGPVQAKPKDPPVAASLGKVNDAIERLHLAVTGQRAVEDLRRSGGLMLAIPDQQDAFDAWVTRARELSEGVNDDAVYLLKEFRETLDEQTALFAAKAGVPYESDVKVDLPGDDDDDDFNFNPNAMGGFSVPAGGNNAAGNDAGGNNPGGDNAGDNDAGDAGDPDFDAFERGMGG